MHLTTHTYRPHRATLSYQSGLIKRTQTRNLLPSRFVDPLAWLGLKSKKDAQQGLSAIQSEVRSLLPDDEPVVVRYIVIVAVLLTRIAFADGRVETRESWYKSMMNTWYKYLRLLSSWIFKLSIKYNKTYIRWFELSFE